MTAITDYNALSDFAHQSKESSNSSIFINYLKQYNWSTVVEINYMKANVTKDYPDGYSLHVEFRSYDPSGPFQNLPDINKITIELWQLDKLVHRDYTEFED